MTCPNAAVAVLLPIYGKDDPDHFRLALRSVLDQEGVTHAIRVYLHVDGPIGPELQAVVEQHRGALYRVLQAERTLGLAAALNRVIGELEDEEVVFRMDADDISRPDRFRLQIAFLQIQPGL